MCQLTASIILLHHLVFSHTFTPSLSSSLLLHSSTTIYHQLLGYSSLVICVQCDLPEKEGVAASPAQMDDYCQTNGFAAWFETSAKENVGIEDASRTLINEVLSFPSPPLPSTSPAMLHIQHI